MTDAYEATKTDGRTKVEYQTALSHAWEIEKLACERYHLRKNPHAGDADFTYRETLEELTGAPDLIDAAGNLYEVVEDASNTIRRNLYLDFRNEKLSNLQKYEAIILVYVKGKWLKIHADSLAFSTVWNEKWAKNVQRADMSGWATLLE